MDQASKVYMVLATPAYSGVWSEAKPIIYTRDLAKANITAKKAFSLFDGQSGRVIIAEVLENWEREYDPR